MALQIFGTNSIGAGIRADLTTADDVFIAAGVTVGSTSGTAITGTGSFHAVNIQGTVLGNFDAVVLGDDGTADSGHELIIGSNGYLGQFSQSGYGAWLSGYNSTVDNSGTIWSGSLGIYIVASNAATQSTVNNSGLIEAKSYGIYHGGTETLVVENSGTIKSTTAYFGSDAIDQITNTGTIRGNVTLNGGNDIFDTKLGTLVGTVNAGTGTDKLYGSALADTFYGGDDGDTIFGYGGDDQLYGENGNDTMVGGDGADFFSGGAGSDRASYSASTSGLAISLLTPSLNTGEAKGDTYDSMENLSGSNFNDSLYGNNFANAISGAGGNDFIRGFGGSDTLTGGAGNDSFYFNTSLSANVLVNTDTITDFNAIADSMLLENAVFTTLTTTGVLAATAFIANATGVAADGSDRIIYETDTGKVFYDQDGNGASFAGIQFAKLAAGLAITNADFIII